MESINSSSYPLQPVSVAGATEPDVVRLARLIATYAPHDGSFELRIPGVHAIRRSRTNTELVHGMAEPALCIVAQGAKSVMLGNEVYQYDASRMIAFSVDLPVTAQVTRASYSQPFLGFKLDLDPHKIAELVLRVYPHGLPRVHESRGVYVGQVSVSIIKAATRLLDLMAEPGEAELLAPLVIDEILIRLLRSPIGVRVAQLGLTESSVNGIAKAVSWLRENFSQPMKVEDLAELAHMSVSSFHQHFKSVTSMSPLQYQKVLRLQEARRLMLSKMMDATTASSHVGYLSASQFSREYSRFFGSAPSKDIARLREYSTQDLTQLGL
ncbi:AraC family transcriptional regulator [Desulfomonile tiedjei]|uniref:DNA-binding domain-containing protein, AraC-type n=1 Tax=Desulfomonile tiedjei (strain ATCC 49306 / DSM 6799 / DCB-1) TaxID=706587 RepID=I4C525_DESTA|nr:DNA-binding domain-containing protein, AraC-type [Desulfomonile tiedjei DSM 6799]